MTRSTNIDYDVVIVGAGIVGATLACALAVSKLRIAIIEHELPVSAPTGDYDLRVSAISPGSRVILDGVGALAGMAEERICPVDEMHVWDAGGTGAIHFDSADIGEPHLAYIIENNAIRAALTKRIGRYSNVRLCCPRDVDTIDVTDSRVELRLTDGTQVSARVVVGADGPRSRVRQQAGIDLTAWGYAQQGIVATVATEQSHANTAWQRFLPTGPLAFLPLADGRCSIVWSVDSEQADILLAHDDREFVEALATAFGDRLGAIVSTSKRIAFPLQRAHAKRYVDSRIALIGDAAHTVHPLAGQGVNLGLMDAAVLAEVLLEADGAGRDVGSVSVLRRYERWRKGDNLAMLAVTDGLKRLFGNSTEAMARVRNLGLDVTDSIRPVKNMFMRRAAGLDGDLPRLARGLSAVSAQRR
jgi:2-polyprenylphenol 6-hydroxylase